MKFNKEIFKQLVNKIGSNQGVYSAVRRKEKQFKNSIKPTTAFNLVASENNIKISNYLDDNELSKVNKLLEISLPINKTKTKNMKDVAKEIKEINPYNLHLSKFNIDTELINDCKVIQPYRGCIREALLTLETKIKEKLKINKNGKALISECKKREIFKRDEPSEEEGLFFLFMGAILWLRNPPSHRKLKYSKEDAMKIILFTDHLINLFYQLCDENKIK